MEPSTVDLPPPPAPEVSSPEPAENKPPADSSGGSGAPAPLLAEAWVARGPAGAVELPERLESLGAALRFALQLGGAVGEAYIAFANQAFASASAVPAASHFVARLFVEEQGVLVNLVRTTDLLAELENGCNEVTRMIALRWQAGNMTQRISRFGESLVHHQDRLKNPAAAESLVAFADLLALSKPKRAASLFELAIKITDLPGTKDFVAGVRARLAAGQLIDPMSPEDRAFWQQCLDGAEPTADWSSAEACSALQALAGRLKLDSPCAALFQQTVPASWWANHMLPPAPVKMAETAKEAQGAAAQPVADHEPAGVPAEASVAEPAVQVPSAPDKGGAATEATEPEALPVAEPEPAETPAQVPHAVAVPIAQPSPPTAVADVVVKPAATSPPQVVVTPPSSAMSFLAGQLLGMALVAGVWIIQPDLLPRALGTASGHWFGASVPAAPAPAPAPAPAAPAASRPPPAASSPQPPSVGEKWRQDEIARLSASNPALKPWVIKVQGGTMAECADLLRGGQPVAYPTMADYRVFLRWLMIAPPRDPELRYALPRIFVRACSLSELIELCEHLSYPGSPSAQGIPTIAQIALDMHGGMLTGDEEKRLQKLAVAP